MPWLIAVSCRETDCKCKVVMASDSIHVLLIGSSPTSYERPLFERVARYPGIDFHACYCESKRWDMIAEDIPYRATILRGIKFPPGQATSHSHLNPGILSLLWREKPEVVVLGGYHLLTALLAIVWCWLTSTPYVLYCESHNISPRKRYIRWLKELYVRPIVNRAAAYISLGKASREYLISYGAQDQTVFTVPNLPDIHWFHSEAERYLTQAEPGKLEKSAVAVPGFSLIANTLQNQPMRFLYVGRLIHVRGLEYLLRAFSKLQKTYPSVALTIVGIGPLERSLKSLARALQLINVNFLGGLPHRELPKIYTSSDVFVLPSLYETYGTVVAEAMTCQLPIILSRQVGSAPDLLEEGENGLLVKEHDVDDLYQAMKWMVEHPTERHSMGKRSWEIIRQWDYDRMVKEFLNAVWTARTPPSN